MQLLCRLLCRLLCSCYAVVMQENGGSPMHACITNLPLRLSGEGWHALSQSRDLRAGTDRERWLYRSLSVAALTQGPATQHDASRFDELICPVADILDLPLSG